MSAETILQAVREAFKTANSLTDAQVIVAESDGVRPALPYATVRVSATGGQQGTPAQIDEIDSGSPTRKVRALSEGVVSVQVYGSGGHAWLEAFELSLATGAVPEQLRAAGVVLVARGTATNVAQLLDTGHEPRWSLDFTARYCVETSPETLTELLTTQTSATFRRTPDVSDDPDPLSFSFSA